MERKIAKTISILFHPLFIPTYAILLLMNVNTHHTLILPENMKYIAVLFVFLTSCVLPALVMLILLKFGRISSLEMDSKQERVFPLFIVALFFYLTYYLMKQAPYFALFNVFMLGATLLVIVSLLVNYLTKISIHMVAMGGLFGTFAGFALAFNINLTFLLYLIALLAGITGFARLELKAHSSFQVYLGFTVGVIFMLTIFVFM